jgi:hypothetical protein
MRILFAITLSHIRAGMLSIRPVGCADATVKGILFPQEIILCGIRYRHEACVDSETGLVVLGTEIVMGSTRVPQKKITWFGRDLLPCASTILKPLHATLRETVPFRGPGRNSLFVRHVAVEFFGEEVTTAANNETTIIRSIGEQVHKALHAAETVLLGILVLVRPGLVGGNIGATFIEVVSVNYIT